MRLPVSLARRPARSRLTALLAACCALAMLGSALHHLLAPHAVCAEHGETIDAPAPGPRTPPPPVAQLEAAASAVSQDQHEHCALVHHRRALWLTVPAVSVSAPPATCKPAHGSGARPACGPRQSLLSLAPKSSPPAA